MAAAKHGNLAMIDIIAPFWEFVQQRVVHFCFHHPQEQ